MFALLLLEHLRILTDNWLVLKLELINGKVHFLQPLVILEDICDFHTLGRASRQLRVTHIVGWGHHCEIRLDLDSEGDECARIPILVTN